MEYETVLKAESSLQHAMLESDIELLNTLISDDLVFTTHDGRLLSKSEDMENHKNGVVKFDVLDITERVVKLFNEFAIVSATANIVATFNNNKSSGAYAFTRVWLSEGELLKVVAGHVSELA